MNSDWVIFSHDIIFDKLFKVEANYLLSDWIFDFDLSDKLICFYIQKSLFLKTNIKSFSASHIINYVEASMTESSVSLSVKILIKLSKSVKQISKWWVKSWDRSQIKLILKLIIKFEFSMSSADTEFNKMMNFLYLNISDEMFFSNYSWKRMSFRLLWDVKKSTWLITMYISCNANC